MSEPQPPMTLEQVQPAEYSLSHLPPNKIADLRMLFEQLRFYREQFPTVPPDVQQTIIGEMRHLESNIRGLLQ